MGIQLAPADVAFRCNLVTLTGSDRLEDCVMTDYSAGEISTEEAAQLISAMDALFRTDRVELHPGISYRHCLVLRQAETGGQLTPPHDISGRPVREFLPRGENSALLREMMERSFALLR